jgi:hypothetical protein
VGSVLHCLGPLRAHTERARGEDARCTAPPGQLDRTTAAEMDWSLMKSGGRGQSRAGQGGGRQEDRIGGHVVRYRARLVGARVGS